MNGMVCVDASVAAKWILPEEDSGLAEALVHDADRHRTRLIGPPHLTAEVTGAVSKRVHRGEITADEALARLGAYLRIPVEVLSLPDLPIRALQLTAEFGWWLPYDAFYLALGELLDCDVWTADWPFFESAHPRYPRLKFLADYPA